MLISFLILIDRPESKSLIQAQPQVKSKNGKYNLELWYVTKIL